MQVTINDVRHGLMQALDAAFPDIPISGEEIKQELNPPHFFVRLLDVDHTRELGRRYRREHPFVVHYFGPERANHEAYDMAEQLAAALEWITVGGRPAFGQDMDIQVVDGVLLFSVSFRLMVWKKPTVTPPMEKMNLREELR
ncbi:hypothetical protein SAMN04487969_11971 [Paenibacillus algorifonticola]|uniref:Uncharacterized protein n=1 Tax=Paenibacillus algorifonticola TaxID=684063 RepID=A0A1I2H140_9BACL|nr:hypothetical protein [Paenibacillus algorifonticola]SFF23093.1 hypothetical protein SAMN04487969_11971 [Paenibacillus algorifonticola]